MGLVEEGLVTGLVMGLVTGLVMVFVMGERFVMGEVVGLAPVSVMRIAFLSVDEALACSKTWSSPRERNRMPSAVGPSRPQISAASRIEREPIRALIKLDVQCSHCCSNTLLRWAMIEM
jgi:hypothetical protein